MEFVKCENGNGMQLGPLLITFASSAKPGKSIMMDYVMADEVARIHPVDVLSEFEQDLQGAIVYWMLNTTSVNTYGMDMKDVIKLFWNERLN